VTGVPGGVLRAYGWERAAVEPLAGGLINLTFAVRGPGGAPRAVLQRLHRVFAPEVNLDLEAVTEHLAARGLATPRLLRTAGGQAWIGEGEQVWRALSWIDGDSFHRAPSLDHGRSAGELVGRFHRALADYQRPFGVARVGVHDTAAHLARLAEVAAASAGADAPAEIVEARALAAAIAAHAATLPPLGDLPLRVCHGDLKLSNVMFAPGRAEALCLVDLDTLGRMRLCHELGDALRSWGNLAGEDVAEADIDLPTIEAALTGYGAAARDLLVPGEAASIAPGLETICVELAARFCVDVFEDRYFGWDATRFATRRVHNLLRARGQASLAASVRARRAALAELVRAALG
jgi:Ser/Thr protein kinase RdoA (MazF antagonist)